MTERLKCLVPGIPRSRGSLGMILGKDGIQGSKAMKKLVVVISSPFMTLNEIPRLRSQV